MVDQTTLGHRYITQQFGVVPTVTWQIDPFGHSATQAALFGPLSGMDAVFFARIDYQDKRRRAATRELEMVWRSSPSLGEKAQVFAGAFPGDYLYFAPPGFCYDVGCSDPVIQNNKSLPGYNLDTIVDAFVETALGQAAQTNGNNIMWTLGGDFEVSASQLAASRTLHHSCRGRLSSTCCGTTLILLLACWLLSTSRAVVPRRRVVVSQLGHLDPRGQCGRPCQDTVLHPFHLRRRQERGGPLMAAQDRRLVSYGTPQHNDIKTALV